MLKIKFEYDTGETVEVEANKGDTVMQAAVDNLIAGIAAECGGACSCATCHVIIGTEWLDLVGRAEDVEKDMLESLANSGPASRLCCQVEIEPSLDGMTVHIPSS